MFERPGKLSDKLPAPYMNEASSLGSALPALCAAAAGECAVWRRQAGSSGRAGRHGGLWRAAGTAGQRHLAPCPGQPPRATARQRRHAPRRLPAGARSLRQRRRLPPRPLPHHQGAPQRSELRLLPAAGLPRAAGGHLGEGAARLARGGEQGEAGHRSRLRGARLPRALRHTTIRRSCAADSNVVPRGVRRHGPPCRCAPGSAEQVLVRPAPAWRPPRDP